MLVRISLYSRSRIWRAVTNLPSLPASGPSLTANCIWMVGGSSSVNGTGSRSSLSHKRFTDGQFLEAGDADDIARLAVDDFTGLEAAELPDLGHGGAFALAVLVDADDRVADFDVAAGDLADGDAADVIAPVEIADEHLEMAP